MAGAKPDLDIDMHNDIDYDYPLLGLATLDNAHRALLDRLAQLASASDQEFAARFPALVADIERDFRSEEVLMEELGAASFQAHLEQHARMLSALHHAASHVQRGDMAPGREASVLLPQWLWFHIATLDKALVDATQ